MPFLTSVNMHTLAQLEIELMQLYAQQVKIVLQQNNLQPQQITAIGLHGQTIRHHPKQKYPYTWQLAEPSALAALTGIDVISHFRQSDIANGGQGAPLAAIFHQQLLQQNNTTNNNAMVLNLGGIANLSCFYADGHTVAFDTGPANTLLDLWVREAKLNEHGFDVGGELANQGKVDTELLKNLLAEPYFSQAIPKSTGRELFNLDWLNQKINTSNKKLAPLDVLTTLTALTTESIIAAIANQNDVQWDALWFCGGGINNHFLIESISKKLTKKYPNINIDLLSNKVNIPDQSIEASAWAWLAYLYQQNIALDLQYITGSNNKVVLGRLSKH